MPFDYNDHLERLRIIKYAEELFPEEKNVSVLYKKGCELLGVKHSLASSRNVTVTNGDMEKYKEAVKEVAKTNSKFVQECPQCNRKSLTIFGLCSGCSESEGGVFKTMWKCPECGYTKKSVEPMVVWMNRLGVDFGTQTKESLGIKTVTKEGIK